MNNNGKRTGVVCTKRLYNEKTTGEAFKKMLNNGRRTGVVGTKRHYNVRRTGVACTKLLTMEVAQQKTE